MAEIQLTQAQQAAVDNRGGSLLVSAAAGSGKTKVLVERLFAYMERERCDVDDFLIITYTKAAAAELRGKIAAELSRRVAVHPESGHLRPPALSCLSGGHQDGGRVLRRRAAGERASAPRRRQHALTPDFRVLDEQEAQLLRERVLERVMETFYARLEAGDAEGELLAETLGAGRDDRALTALVLEEHSKIQSHPYPLAWLEQVFAAVGADAAGARGLCLRPDPDDRHLPQGRLLGAQAAAGGRGDGGLPRARKGAMPRAFATRPRSSHTCARALRTAGTRWARPCRSSRPCAPCAGRRSARCAPRRSGTAARRR